MNDILFGNNNGAVIKKLSGRYFKASKSRNIIAIIAIVLTTILFTTIFTLGSGLMDTVHDQNIRKAGGDGQAVLNYISDEVYNDIAGSSLIDRIAYTKAVSYRLQNPGLERWRSDLWYMDDTALEFARYTPTTGRRPEAEHEIIADTKTLDALGVPAQIGETVSLTYEVKGKLYTTDFTLCGFWETDSLSNIGRLVVSKAFVDAHSDILTYTYPVDNDYSGVVSAYVMFRGNGDIEAQLHQLLSETGYTCDTMGGSKENGNYVIARVSPAYQSGALINGQSCHADFRPCWRRVDCRNRVFDYLQHFPDFCHSGYSVLWTAENAGDNQTADQASNQPAGAPPFLDWYSHRPADWIFDWPGLGSVPDERNELYRRRRC